MDSEVWLLLTLQSKEINIYSKADMLNENISMEDCGFTLFITSCSYHHLEVPFWLKWQGSKTGLNGRETKLAWMEGQKN